MSRAPATILLRLSLTCVGLVGSCWVSLALVGLRLPMLARVGRSGSAVAIVGCRGLRSDGCSCNLISNIRKKEKTPKKTYQAAVHPPQPSLAVVEMEWQWLVVTCRRGDL